MSICRHRFIPRLVWSGPLLPCGGFWLGLQPSFLFASFKHERHRQYALLAIYLVIFPLILVAFVQLTIEKWPLLDRLGEAIVVTKWMIFLFPCSCIVFFLSGNATKCRHGIYAWFFYFFGVYPLIDALIDSASHHYILLIVCRRCLYVLANACLQWSAFGVISIPILMLSLPGLTIYTIRCLLNVVFGDSAEEGAQLKAVTLKYNIGVQALTVFTSVFCVLLVHVLYVRMLYRMRVHPEKPITIGRQSVDMTPVVPSAHHVPNMDEQCLDDSEEPRILQPSSCLHDGPGQEHASISDESTHFQLGVHVGDDSPERGVDNVHFLANSEVMLVKHEQQEVDEEMPSEAQPGETLSPLDAPADPPTLPAPLCDSEVSEVSVCSSMISEGTAVSAGSSTAAMAMRVFNHSFLHGALCALEAVQVVSSEAGSLVTNLDSIHSRTIAVGNRKVPQPQETMEFQGAWEQLRGALIDSWLRTFIITGRTYFSGDGNEGFLLKRSYDNAILLEGGVLQIQPNGNLARTGKSGRVVLFRRISVASQADVTRFQGLWASHDAELLIESIVWTLNGRVSGLVKLEQGNTMLSTRILSMTDAGNICLLSPSGNRTFFVFVCSLEELDLQRGGSQQG